MTQYESVRYETDGRIARITLDRPDKLNAIDPEMPGELREAVERANGDEEVRVIALSGAGRAFCSGYDLEIFAERPRPVPGSQEMPWDPMEDYRQMGYLRDCYMSLWESPAPVVCKVHGFAVAGGSDIALCCDQIVMGDHAKIGYPPVRVWGCPTTAMWIYRVGLERAKRMLLTGKLVDGREAERMGLVSEAVPEADLEERVEELIDRIAGIPANQLMMHKKLVNQAYANMGMETTQMLATLFDGIARHTPEGVAFKDRAEEVGFQRAVEERDAGEVEFGDS